MAIRLHDLGSREVSSSTGSTDNSIARYDGTSGLSIQQSDLIIEDSGNLDHKTSGATLSIGGTNASVINIGRSGATINIIGTTTYEQTTNTQVSDKLITINKGGGVSTASGTGIEFEENNSITGYIKTSSDRNSFELLAPNTAGVITITPGSSDFTIDNKVVRSTSSSSTDNRVVRMDSTTGKLIQESAVTIDDSGNISGIANLNISGTATIGTLSGVLKGTAGVLSASNVNLTSEVTGALPIANGGTGQTSASAAFDAISPVTNRGDLIYRNATTNARLAIGAANTILKTDGTDPLWALITNDNIDGSAAISYSKLNLSGSIVNADINGSAAIAYSKLNLSSSIVNADISGSAAIAYSKLNLSGSIVNADISGSAAISRSKIANGTAYGVVTNDSSGALTSVAPSTSGNVLTSDGTQWVSSAPASNKIQSYELSNLAISATVAANALTIAIKTEDGGDPAAGDKVVVGFPAPGTGDFFTVEITSALSMTVSSGSTLGHSSGNNHYIYVYLINNSGTAEVAVSSILFDEGTLVSTTAEGGAGGADSNRVMYSTTARSNVSNRLIGRIKSNQATAGTWATTPTEISLLPFIPQNVVAVYESNAGQSISNNTYTNIDFEDRVIDTHNAVITGAAWRFVAPITGNYLVAAHTTWNGSSSWDIDEFSILKIRRDGVDYAFLSVYNLPATSASAIQPGNSGTSIINLTAGQELDVQIFQNTGGSLALLSTPEHIKVYITLVGR